MKRFVLCIGVLCVLLSLCFIISACDEITIEQEEVESTSNISTSKECEHDYEVTVIEKATCLAQGTKRFSCKNCTSSYTETYSMPTHTADDIYKMASKCVGEIITYDKQGNELALGTGIVYSADGEILTNYHVMEDAYSAKISINGKTYMVQKVLAYDEDVDLIMLKINVSGLKVLPFCTKKVQVGTPAYALGSSKGMTSTFSQGIITYAEREVENVVYVQHDAAISSGNSGGPLINKYGEIIGINTMTIKDSQNLNFAIFTTEIENLVYGTELTVKEFYEKECDPFNKLKDYIVAKGEYDSEDHVYMLELGYTYSSDYESKYVRRVYYYADDDEVTLDFLIYGSNWVYFIIDEVDGVYNWNYFDENDYSMSGVLHANTYTTDTLLGYSNNNISASSVRSAVRELASVMISELLLNIDNDFALIDVTAEDLGFCYY